MATMTLPPIITSFTTTTPEATATIWARDATASRAHGISFSFFFLANDYLQIDYAYACATGTARVDEWQPPAP